jgi:hypothetical protein
MFEDDDVCCTCATSRRNRSLSVYVYLSGKYGVNKEISSFISRKKKRDSPPIILVTKNPNWS